MKWLVGLVLEDLVCGEKVGAVSLIRAEKGLVTTVKGG